MSLFYYICKECGEPAVRVCTAKEAKKKVPCKKCGGKLKRTPKAATVKVVETLDNGIMVRRVERIADAERIMWDRAHPAPNEFEVTAKRKV